MADPPNPFEEIEELFDQFSTFGDPLQSQVPVDLLDTGDDLVVKVDLPGRDPDSVSVRLTDNQHLHLEAKPRTDDEDGRYVTRERTQESLSRTVSLPAAVDESTPEASYEQGVLTVRLSKLTGDSDGTDIPVN